MPETKSLIIDCDTGRDDALAIWLACALNLPVAGIIASYGNTIVANVADNTARVLALAGRDDIPLYAGAGAPLRPHSGFEKTVKARQASSGNGLCNLDLPRSQKSPPPPLPAESLAQEIKRLAARNGPLEYVILGPATNFAAMCDIFGSGLRHVIARVTMMGGKFSPLWDGNPFADFNLISDPFAFERILCHDLEFRLVPVNATWDIQLPLADIERLRPASAVAETAKNLMISHCRHFAPEPVFHFHDPAVILTLLRPSGFSPALIGIDCDETGGNFARLTEHPDGRPVKIFSTDEKSRQDLLNIMLDNLGLFF